MLRTMFKGLLLILFVICIRNSSCAIDALYDTGRELWKLYSAINEVAFNETHEERRLSNDRMLINQEVQEQMNVIHEQLNQIEEFMNPKIILDTFKPTSSNVMLYRSMDTLQLFISSIDEYYRDFRQWLNVSNHHYDNGWLNLRENIILSGGEKIQMIRTIVLEANDYLPNEENLVAAIVGYASFRMLLTLSQHQELRLEDARISNTNMAAIDVFIKNDNDDNWTGFFKPSKSNDTRREKFMKNYWTSPVIVGHRGSWVKTSSYRNEKSIQIHLCGRPHIISEVLFQLFRMVIIAEIKVNVILAFAELDRYRQQFEWMNLSTREEFVKKFGSYVNQFSMYIESAERFCMRACDPANGIWIRDKSFYELEGTFQATIFHYHWVPCKFHNCNNIWMNGQKECDAEYYDTRSGCSTNPTECAYLNAIHACVLYTGPHKFQYVNSTELGSLGKNFTCPESDGYMIEDGQGWNIHYAACVCNCNGNHNKISLKIIQSTVRRNMVIIGLRFIRKDGILYLQPKEGKLDANGYILRYSERWIPIRSDLPASHLQSVDRDNKIFFLDDLRLPPRLVLTGVKFNKVTRKNKTGFAIEIFGSPFDYRTGKLQDDIVFRTSEREANKNSGEGLSFKRVSSVYTASLHTPSFGSQYVSLERSELRDDFGQSTLPFFDAAPINLHPPSALGGVGLFHKGTEGHAGFISLRVYGISYARYFLDFESCHMKNGRVKFDSSNCN